MKKIVSIVGARPQFIKYGPLGRKLKANFKEWLIHTGQHYDKNMSELFFRQLSIPEPDFNLGIGSGSHGTQTAGMMLALEPLLEKLAPDVVLVFGDTNSTIAGALTAAKLHIKVAHVEAGLRSFNKQMPEEINRILTDHCSDLLFCPTETAVSNLKKENIIKNVFNTGDIMYDAFLENIKVAEKSSTILNQLGLNPEEYFLATVHRAENTENLVNLKNILNALNQLNTKVILPLHPRTAKIINKEKLTVSSNIKIIEPVGYLDMLILLQNCRKVITDSGGLQKESFFARKYCKTIRTETEWTETLDHGFNVICGTEPEKIVNECLKEEKNDWHLQQNPFGDGKASERIIEILMKS